MYHGADPLGEKKAQRELPTMDELMDRFERDYFRRLLPSSLKPYRNATTRIRKRWKHTLVQDLTHGEVDAFFNALSRATPVLVNLTLSVLARALSLAVRLEWLCCTNRVQGFIFGIHGDRSSA